MSCSTIQKSLSAYMDRELPLWEKGPVAIHLEDCASCQSELQTLINIKSELRSYAMPSMPEDLREAIESATWRRQEAWKSKFQFRWWAPALAVAAGTAAWLFLKNGVYHRQPVTPPVMAEAQKEEEKTIALHSGGTLVSFR